MVNPGGDLKSPIQEYRMENTTKKIEKLCFLFLKQKNTLEHTLKVI